LLAVLLRWCCCTSSWYLHLCYFPFVVRRCHSSARSVSISSTPVCTRATILFARGESRERRDARHHGRRGEKT
ncbi:hypothetical protein PFISCL1PPCAC_11741, partial [Pristionchus fissidentatus]